ncbi:MAG TPA: PDZ domain-containing protein [Kofleriaceae bacterium]
MRLVTGALALVLFASIARAEDTTTSEPARSVRSAEDPAHSKIPLRVVRVMPESHQALLFDRARATHVLAEIGGKLDGYTVEDIDDDTVTLNRDSQRIVLVAPPHANRRHRDAAHDRDTAHVRSAAARPSDTAEPAPVDPYDDALPPGAAPAAVASSHAPAATEVGETGIRTVHAPDGPVLRPVVPGEGGIRVAEAPGAAPAPATSAPAPAAAVPAPSGSPAPAPTPGPPTDLGHAPAAETASAGGSGIRAVAAPSQPASDAPAPAAPSPPASPGPVVHPTLATNPTEPRAANAVRAPDRQALDARALADVMTSDGRTRGPRPPAAGPQAADSQAHPVPAAPVASDTRTGDAMVISRGDLDRALADFAGLTSALRGSFSASGVTVESVGEGTIFQRAGLRAGDVITSVDGARLRSLDDAANLYVRASTAQAMTAQVLRGGKPVTLRVVIQ